MMVHFDECGDVTLQVARMIEPLVYSDRVEFDCMDVDSTIMVALLVTDQGGNTNICMVSVDVKDKIPASITCPTDITIDCTTPYDLDNLDSFGTPDITDNCSSIGYDEIMSADVNQCAQGSITRTFEVLGIGSQTCTQTITILNQNAPFGLNNITWPDNYSSNNGCTEGDLSPSGLANINTSYGPPTVEDGSACILSGMNYTDEEFTGGAGACRTIYRHWNVIDWCTELPGGGFPQFPSYSNSLK